MRGADFISRVALSSARCVTATDVAPLLLFHTLALMGFSQADYPHQLVFTPPVIFFRSRQIDCIISRLKRTREHINTVVVFADSLLILTFKKKKGEKESTYQAQQSFKIPNKPRQLMWRAVASAKGKQHNSLFQSLSAPGSDPPPKWPLLPQSVSLSMRGEIPAWF